MADVDAAGGAAVTVAVPAAPFRALAAGLDPVLLACDGQDALTMAPRPPRTLSCVLALPSSPPAPLTTANIRLMPAGTEKWSLRFGSLMHRNVRNVGTAWPSVSGTMTTSPVAPRSAAGDAP